MHSTKKFAKANTSSNQKWTHAPENTFCTFAVNLAALLKSKKNLFIGLYDCAIGLHFIFCLRVSHFNNLNTTKSLAIVHFQESSLHSLVFIKMLAVIMLSPKSIFPRGLLPQYDTITALWWFQIRSNYFIVSDWKKWTHSLYI